MLNLDTRELRETYRAAIESAALLRSEGNAAKAARVESLARVISRELERREGRREENEH